MDKRLTYLPNAAAKVNGEPTESFPDGATVWASVRSASERSSFRFGRTEFPGARVATVDPHADAALGNRVRVKGVEYAIVGVDDTRPDFYGLLLEKVTR